MQSMPSHPYAAPTRPFDTLAYLRRVYALFAGGIAFVVFGALLALYAGPAVELRAGWDSVQVSPVVAFGLQHPILSLIVYVGAFFAANGLRQRPGVNVAALFGFTFVTGLFVAPAIFIAQLMATQGATLSASPVRDAFLLTAASFTGLTSYVFITKKDFSFMGAALSMGTWVLLGAIILSLFVGSAALNLAIASVGVLLFSGYILYDTSRILHARDESDPVGAALRLFLDVLNLFLFLLRILSSRRS